MKSSQKSSGIKRSKHEDLFSAFYEPTTTTTMPRKKAISQEAPEDYNDFVVWFMETYKAAINRHVRRRLIPNRYSVDDVRAYVAERILSTLQRRKRIGKPIEEPKIYFRKLIDFYCVEYQRMSGYIYCLPKRPRSPESEADIAQYGFVYFTNDMTNSPEYFPELGYVDATVDTVEHYHEERYSIKGEQPEKDTEAWGKMMLMALPEDQKVLECVFKMNLSVPEASRHLGIAVSTAYQRVNRGIKAISGTLCTYVDLDDDSWKLIENISSLDDQDVDIKQFYENK